MNDQISIGQLEVQNLQKVAGCVRADAETLDGLGESVGGAVLDGVEHGVLLGPRQFQDLT